MGKKIYINGDVVTMDPEIPRAEAFGVSCGRVCIVGGKEEVSAWGGPEAEVVDLQGLPVLPGFIETHNHFTFFALTLSQIDFSDCRTIERVVAKIEARAAESSPGEWIVGHSFDDTALDDRGDLTMRVLDAAANENPVMVIHSSGHLVWCNSQAFALAGIGPDTPNPEGGEFVRDANNELTGLAKETAFQPLVDQLPVASVEDYKKMLLNSVPYAHAAGVTSIHDGVIGRMGEGPNLIQALNELGRDNALGLRAYLTIIPSVFEELMRSGLGTGFGNENVKIGCVKMFQDGSIQGWTAALSEPYYDKPDFKGGFIWPQEVLEAMVEKYHAAGQQLAIHANGDAAIESVIQAFEKAQAKHPREDARHMIIHAQTASLDHIKRMKKLGVIPSYFVNHVYYWGDRHIDMFLGPERSARISPLASSVKEGLVFTLHSDLPVTPISPLDSIHNAVNRVTKKGQVLGPDERISAFEAVKAYTTYAAKASFEEDIKGSITPGKLADFVVLSENPLDVPSARIKDIQVLRTFVGGDSVFSSD